MADITLFVKLDGADAEAAVPIIQDTARVLRDWLSTAGHTLASAKVAVTCQACGKLLNPGMGIICNSCACEQALERQLDEITGVPLPMPMAALEPAEALFE